MLKERLQAVLGSPVLEVGPLPVGFGLEGLTLRLADGRRLAVKARAGGAHPSLDIEAYMLGELRRLSALPVPQVHFADADLLVMDFIETDGGGITPGVERHAAELIAELHATPRASFGYARDTLIGPLPQPNPQSALWVPFFRDHRLLHMARAAHREGQLPSPLLARIERLAARASRTIWSSHPSPACCMAICGRGTCSRAATELRASSIPALYCGSPEIELAFTTMFGTFGPAFFDAYEALAPLEPGFHATRRGLYNLYPGLVHVRLFGAAYLAGIDRTLRSLGF